MNAWIPAHAPEHHLLTMKVDHDKLEGLGFCKFEATECSACLAACFAYASLRLAIGCNVSQPLQGHLEASKFELNLY